MSRESFVTCGVRRLAIEKRNTSALNQGRTKPQGDKQ
jgi:hypothetical protein